MGYSAKKGLIIVSLVTALAIWAAGAREAEAAWGQNTIGDYTYWDWDGAQKFRYQISNQQWWHYSTVGVAWFTLSTTGRPNTFLGDGGWYALGTGLDYRYDVANNFGFFRRGPTYRFYYRYAPGQWFTSGFGGGWYVLGVAGLTAAVLGDGATRSLGNGLNYRYLASSDFGFFSRGSAYRFYYNFGTGQWFTSGSGGGWYVLGVAGFTASVMGDGGWHTLGNGYNYLYAAANDFGYFSIEGTYRFYYRYTQGQWYASGYGGGWHVLSNTGVSASFIGDRAYHNLGNGWWYRYVDGAGFWSTNSSSAGDRFLYYYGPGLWQHRGYDGDFYELGDTRVSASFVGDGAQHYLNIPGFVYLYAGGVGTWRTNTFNADDRFQYNYGIGQWYHRGDDVGFSPLGPAGLSPSFLGDGAFHAIGNGWYYHYEYAAGTNDVSKAYFSRDAFLTGGIGFRYYYLFSLWEHRGQSGTWSDLGHWTTSAAFVADGNLHDLGNGYQYIFNLGDYYAYWLGASDSWSYNYASGTWEHNTGSGYVAVAGPGVGTNVYNPGEP